MVSGDKRMNHIAKNIINSWKGTGRAGGHTSSNPVLLGPATDLGYGALR